MGEFGNLQRTYVASMHNPVCGLVRYWCGECKRVECRHCSLDQPAEWWTGLEQHNTELNVQRLPGYGRWGFDDEYSPVSCDGAWASRIRKYCQPDSSHLGGPAGGFEFYYFDCNWCRLLNPVAYTSQFGKMDRYTDTDQQQQRRYIQWRGDRYAHRRADQLPGSKPCRCYSLWVGRYADHIVVKCTGGMDTSGQSIADDRRSDVRANFVETKMKRFLILLGLATALSTILSAQSSRLTSITQIKTNASRIYGCISGCTAGAELTYDSNTSGATCPNGGKAIQIYTNTYGGGSEVNISATQAAFSTLTLNAGNVKINPAGTYYVFVVLNSGSNYACNNPSANPGSGFDYDIWITKSDWSNPTKVETVTPNIGAGSLHPLWNADGSKVCWFNNVGAAGHTAPNVYGNFQCAAFTTPGGVPTLGASTIRCPGNASCTGVFEFYEPAGFNPLNADMVYYTLCRATWDTCAVFSYLISTGATVQITPFGYYSEFWNVSSDGLNALSGTTRFTPNPDPVAYPVGMGVPPSDVSVSNQSALFNWSYITTYNTPATSMYDASKPSIGQPVWANNHTQICWGETKVATTLYCGNYAPFPASFGLIF